MNISSNHTQFLIPLHQYQGTSNNCGPYCTATIINYIYHSQITGDSISEYMNHLHFLGWRLSIKRIPNFATFPWGVTDTLLEYGINSQLMIFTKFEQLCDLLSKNELIIVLTATFRPLTAHYRIVVSIDDNRLGFIDSAHNQYQICYQDKQSFLSGWQNTAHTIILIKTI
jgi:hypothetical protein